MHYELMKELARDKQERMRAELARPRRHRGTHRKPAALKRFLSWLGNATVEAGVARYSTFGYYPEDDSAPLSPDTGFRARDCESSDEYEAQLMAHSSDPEQRAKGEAWLRAHARDKS